MAEGPNGQRKEGKGRKEMLNRRNGQRMQIIARKRKESEERRACCLLKYGTTMDSSSQLPIFVQDDCIFQGYINIFLYFMRYESNTEMG